MADITREQVAKIFNMGYMYHMSKQKPNFISGTAFNGSFDDAVDFAYRFVIMNERDSECLNCGRYSSGSCEGTIDRGRTELTERNRCAAFYNKEEKRNEGKDN